MISFKSRNEHIRMADIITRKGIKGNSKPKIKVKFSRKLSTRKINELKNNYPELMIKDYKKIVL